MAGTDYIVDDLFERISIVVVDDKNPFNDATTFNDQTVEDMLDVSIAGALIRIERNLSIDE